MKIISTDCFQVKGYNRSTICDLRRQSFYEVPTFNSLNTLSIDFFEFLEQNEVIIDIPAVCSKQFLPISLKYIPIVSLQILFLLMELILQNQCYF